MPMKPITPYRYLALLFLFVCLCTATGCGADPDVVQATAAYQIAQAVTETLMAAADPTPYPTPTAYHTAAPYATHTPYPTATAYPLATAYPTATPYPTFTAAATITLTLVPTQPANNPLATSVPTNPANPEVLVLQYLRQLSTAVGEITGLIDTALNNRGEVDCQAFLDQHDRILALPTVDVSAAILPVQGAYGEYRGSIDEFGPMAADLAQRCRNLLAVQSPASIPYTDWELIRFQLTELFERIGMALRLVGGGA